MSQACHLIYIDIHTHTHTHSKRKAIVFPLVNKCFQKKVDRKFALDSTSFTFYIWNWYLFLLAYYLWFKNANAGTSVTVNLVPSFRQQKR